MLGSLVMAGVEHHQAHPVSLLSSFELSVIIIMISYDFFVYYDFAYQNCTHDHQMQSALLGTVIAPPGDPGREPARVAQVLRSLLLGQQFRK